MDKPIPIEEAIVRRAACHAAAKASATTARDRAALALIEQIDGPFQRWLYDNMHGEVGPVTTIEAACAVLGALVASVAANAKAHGLQSMADEWMVKSLLGHVAVQAIGTLNDLRTNRVPPFIIEAP
ncbi:MAG: hypothetical protein WDM81_13755 [Rhizomicrobium sp.]